MPLAGRLSPRALPLTAGIVGVTLVACVFRPANDPGLERVVKAHYARHATEEAGRCRTPEIDTIQSHQTKTKSKAGDELVAVRYSYYDRHADMDADWSALFHTTQACGGFAERDFSVIRTDLGYRVIDMTGERREDGRTN